MIRYNYLRLLTKSINDYQTRELIASEIMDHIDDQKTAYMEEGMSEREAEEKAVLSMGDPTEASAQFASVYCSNKEIRNLIIYGLFSLLGVVFVGCAQYYTSIFDSITMIMFRCAGYLMIIVGLISGIEEKAMNLPFWYSKNQSGGINLNSYATCALGTAFIAKNYVQWTFWTVLLGAMLWLERDIVGKKQSKKTEKYIWKTGIASSDIHYKGMAEIDGKNEKVRVKKGEIKKGEIKKGTQIVVVNVDGFRLIVEPA